MLASLRLWIVDQLTGWLDRHHESAAWDYTEPTPEEQAAIDRVWDNVQRQIAADRAGFARYAPYQRKPEGRS